MFVSYNPDKLCYIYTEILRSGLHPESWKEEIIVPIPKANKASMRDPKSWRQIHLLTILSKTLQRIVYSRTDEESDHLLSPTQFGTRMHRGVQDAGELMRNWVSRCRESKLRVSFLTKNIEGGFDKVVPQRLVSLPIFPDRYRRWFIYWCIGRKTRYRFNGRLSQILTISSGVPQGSTLSPHLFAF
jgi:hypothetical protein